MFTIEQIIEAHSKVKSGADFPRYVQELISLGVSSYNTFVHDSHAEYSGKNGFYITSPAKYATLEVAGISNKTQFGTALKAHQQGKTDYPAFCRHAAGAGVEKWIVDTDTMTCTYYDKAGNMMLSEKIPGI
ncbi:DUF1398 family protein [uncultured Flavobacterium sp.]|uniref:DUF1398 domain-containing protein n=1 Tax=uncultured Flavobacterium sp. TaxID=165435 RepID=UPI0025E95EE2|nr:DUF1398 family protein [uncultured Flavobacterium sp.]